MPRNKLCSHIISEPILSITLIVTHGGSFEDAERDLKQSLKVKDAAFNELIGDVKDGVYFRIRPEDCDGKTNCSYIWLKNPRNNITILHEATHLVTSIFNDRGIPLRHENDEILAYYLSYWFKTIKVMMTHK